MKIDRENIYAKLPIALQSLAVCAEGWRIQRSRYNRDFHRLLAEYEARTFYTPEQIAAFRDERLRAFLRHGAATTPYYKEKFRELLTGQQAPWEILEQLPILSRNTVQEATDAFISSAPGGPVMTCHTSGSTGTGLCFPATCHSQREHWAVWWRFRRWHGIALNTPCIYLGGRSVVPLSQRRPPFWRYNRPGRQLLLSGYHLGPDTAKAYLDAIVNSQIPWIHGYPSLIALLAGFALEHKVRPNIRWVTLGAENVLPQQEKLIQEAFGVRPFSHYSMAEGVANISQCPEGNFHVDEDFAPVTFIPLNDSEASVVGCNVSNPAFPLLRYEVGDHVQLSAQPCTCGRPGRCIDRIDGRSEDYVITQSGAHLGRLDHIFKDMVHIREAQIRQSEPGKMTVHIVRGESFVPQDEQLLIAAIQKRVGGDIDFSICYETELPRTRSGKLRFVLSACASSLDQTCSQEASE